MTMTGQDEGPPGAETPRPPRQPGKTPSTGKRRPGPVGPAARFEPGRVADPRHRNPTWVVAGVLLVVLSALGGVLLFTSTDDRKDVLVAAEDIEPGAAIAADDLRIERVAVDSRVRSIPGSRADDVVGQRATGRIPAGTMLAPAMVDDETPLGPGEMVVGAALDPGEAPLFEVEVGSSVELLDVQSTTAGEPTTGAAIATTLGTGTVWAVDPVATGQLWLSIRVSREVGLAVSVASAADRLRVVLIGSDG